ncbi:hypothetical protein DSO57_1031533 [Entomophthora muscae]|uniref:Uncharacterized protein n=1 Tax=Entomophthora muscae TaxID=34485 RepID=A0ACC2RRN1_9FUNG|nr:hypothetical protein DSO57_1031533 [Entomophthora muscae]
MKLETLLVAAQLGFSKGADLTILHTNDVHSRYDQINVKGKDCNAKTEACYGGLARLKTKIDEYRRNYPNTLLFDAGDQFQGSMFYTYYRGNASLKAMNHLGYNVSTLGNHEFDNGPLNTGRIVKHYRFPVVSSNIEIPAEYKDLKQKISKSYVFKRYQLGVVGYIFQKAQQEANLEKVRTEDPIQAVQREIKILNDQGIKRVIAVSHNGYEDDIKLAKNVKGLSLIVGGHTHSYLGPKGSTFREKPSEGDYPTNVTNLDGKPTYIVQAHEWSYLLGHVDISFGSDGYIASIKGQAIKLDSSVAMDKDTDALVQKLREPMDKYANEVIGESKVAMEKEACKVGECALGDLVADALLESQKADVVFINSGAIRDSLKAGPVTVGNVLAILPYGTPVTNVQMTGQNIMELLERVFGKVNEKNETVGSIQVAGMQVEFNGAVSCGKRLNLVNILDRNSKKYLPLKKEKKYAVTTLSYLANGGDRVIVPPIKDFKYLDSESKFVIDYIRQKKSITKPQAGRILEKSK